MPALRDLNEDHLIAKHFGKLVAEIDDDCAAIKVPAGYNLLVSTDALCSGVHFTEDAAPHLIAQKAIRSNVSDIVASGGAPQWISWSLSLPSSLTESWIEDFLSGAREALNETSVHLIGGDLTRSPNGIFISVTVLGYVAPAYRLLRKTANVGDLLFVTGYLGEAGLGLDVILNQHQTKDPDHWLRRHFVPPYRGAFAQALAKACLATAMMDLSDGLATDLPRLAKASGRGFEVELSDIPISAKARAEGLDARKAYVYGEDFELLFTAPAEHRKAIGELAKRFQVPLHVIGSLTGESHQIIKLKDTPVTLDTAWRHFA